LAKLEAKIFPDTVYLDAELNGRVHNAATESLPANETCQWMNEWRLTCVVENAHYAERRGYYAAAASSGERVM